MKSKQEFKKPFVKRSFSECAELIKEHFTPSKETSLPYIGLEHIEQGTLRISSIGKSSDVISQKSKFKKNDILFGKLRPYFRKVVCPNFDGICSTDIFVVRAKEGISQNFLYYLMASNEFVNYSSQGSQGTKMPRASWEFLEKYEQGIPSLDEQEEIAKTLSDLDTKIQNLQNQNKILEQTAQTIFKSWFVDFDGVTELEDSELGQIPKGWSVNSIGKISKVVVGYVGPVSKHYCKKLDGIPMIRTTDLKEYGINDIDLKYVTKEFHYKQKKSQLKKGDILIARFGKSGLPCLFDQEYDANCLNAVLIKPDQKECLSYYLLNTLKTSTLQVQFQGSIVGTVQDCLNTKTIAATLILIPSKSILQEFDSFVKPIYSKIKQNNFSIYNSTVTRDALLPKLMSGEIRV